MVQSKRLNRMFVKWNVKTDLDMRLEKLDHVIYSPPPKLRRGGGGNNTVCSNTSFKRINYVDITF